MDLINNHIERHLDKFLLNGKSGLTDLIQLNPALKEDNLLVYVDRVLNSWVSEPQEQVGFHHLHLPETPSTPNQVFAYLITKFFHLGLMSEQPSGNYLEQKIRECSIILKRPWPANAKGKSRLSRIEKQFRGSLRKRVKLLTQLTANYGERKLLPFALINTTQKNESEFIDSGLPVEIGIPIEKYNGDRSYVILNSSLSRDAVDSIVGKNEVLIMNHVRYVVLYDGHTKKLHRGFNVRKLQEWNANHGTNFSKLIVITTSSQENAVARIKQLFDRIHSRFGLNQKYPEYQSYLLTSSEVNQLENKETKGSVNRLSLVGEKLCPSWEDFLFKVNQYEELSELRSTKLLNLYSLAIDDHTSKIIINLIFHCEEKGSVLSSECWQVMNQLPIGFREQMQGALSATFNWLKEINWLGELIAMSRERRRMLISKYAFNFPELVNAFSSAIKESLIIEVVSYDVASFQNDIMLNFKDIGLFPYDTKYTWLEFERHSEAAIIYVHLNIFFGLRTEWMSYKYSKELIRILDNPIRRKYFAWEDLVARHLETRPHLPDALDWSDDSVDESQHSQQVKVVYANSRSRFYNASETFVVKHQGEDTLEVHTLKELLEESLDHMEVQQLNLLYADFNLFETLAKNKLPDSLLIQVNQRFNVEAGTDVKSLWKILLSRKAEELGITQLYEYLAETMNSRRLSFVTMHTFKEGWLNPKSRSLAPREKKTFLLLCEYLELPASYFNAMIMFRNAEKRSARSSNRQMDVLIAELINDGCFNENSDSKSILVLNQHKYLLSHRDEFESIGFDTKNIVDELATLVALLKPRIQLSPISKLEVYE